MLAMMILVIKSSLRLRTIKKSALPLQNSEVRRLYNKCLNEMKITRNIPVYSTAFLKSPIIVGFLKPCIYLPIHLISDSMESLILPYRADEEFKNKTIDNFNNFKIPNKFLKRKT